MSTNQAAACILIVEDNPDVVTFENLMLSRDIRAGLGRQRSGGAALAF